MMLEGGVAEKGLELGPPRNATLSKAVFAVSPAGNAIPLIPLCIYKLYIYIYIMYIKVIHVYIYIYILYIHRVMPPALILLTGEGGDGGEHKTVGERERERERGREREGDRKMREKEKC